MINLQTEKIGYSSLNGMQPDAIEIFNNHLNLSDAGKNKLEAICHVCCCLLPRLGTVLVLSWITLSIVNAGLKISTVINWYYDQPVSVSYCKVLWPPTIKKAVINHHKIYNIIKAQFKEYFAPKTNIYYERYILTKIEQSGVKSSMNSLHI